MTSREPRSLWLLRHAHALDARPGEADSGRELSPRGRERLALAAPRLVERLGPEALILCSPSRRALQTGQALADALGSPGDGARAVECGRLSRPPGPELLALLAALEAPHLVLAGHEPWLSQLAEILLGVPAPGPLKRLGAIELSGRRRPGKARLARLWRPRELREGPVGRA